MNKRGPMQKVAVVVAYISYVCAGACAIAGSMMEAKGEDPIFASLMASIVFFLGVGIVLHVMGSANLPNLKVPPEQ